MGHGMVDVFAFQEALLLEAVLGIAFLAILWAAFRRWIRYKEDTGRLIADRAAQQDAQIERVETRLKALEQAASGAGTQALPDPTLQREDPS